MLPVIFVGAVALLLGSFPFAVVLPPAVAAVCQGGSRLAMLVWNASNGIMALCLVVLISHYLAVEAREKQLAEISPPLVAIVALVNFFIFMQASVELGNRLWMLGAQGVLAAIVVAILSSELLCLCLRIKLLRFGHQSYDLDPNLHLAVRAIVPVLVTVAVFLLGREALSLVELDFSRWLKVLLAALNRSFDSQLPGLLVLSLLHQLLWFVGIHGSNVLESIYPVLFNAADDGTQVFEISKRLINLYSHIGGSGSTLGLLLVILIYHRQGESVRVAKYALIPSLFNINELVIFGLPIAFNPIYFLPFLLVPLLQIVVSYFCLRYGLILIDVVRVPWITPPVLAGTINSASWHGGALQFVNILISAAIYAPFVRFAERQRKTESFNNVRRILSEIEGVRVQTTSVLKRHDDVGHTARKLLQEFMQDLGSSRVFLAYQAQHDAQQRVVGVEALLRWKHRHFGFVSPVVICSLLEESNQIVPLGRWTIAVACQQLCDWKRTGIDNLRMSVNLSPLQLKDRTLLPFIDECLQANQLLPGELALELTESQHVPEDALSVQTLKSLEATGVHLEMDDFGMGYSSMLYIRRFHFDAIKLDGSLTREVLQSNNCCDIIASVVQLARALNMRVVAEYVETREQQVVLERLGCDAFQGYLYTPALVGESCLDYLRRQTRVAAAG